MAYRWRQDGPAFEFPTPFGPENRFLLGRAVFLLAAAAAALLLSALGGASPAEAQVVVLDRPVEPGSSWPLVLAAFLMTLAGVLNLAQALRQRQLLLQPGQPASLAGEVSREASGAGAGAPALLQDLARGLPAPREAGGPWGSLLRRLAPDLVYAPNALRQYLAARLAHALLAAGLAALAGLLMLLPSAGGAALGAMWLLALGAAVAVRHALDADRPALSPRQLGVVLAAAGLGGLALGFATGALPILDKLDRFQLPRCAALAAGAVLAIEVLGMLAARQRVEQPLASRLGHDRIELAFDAAPARLLREVDRELARRWTDGVPSRRYIWQVPKTDAALEEGVFAGAVLEESQPTAIPGPAVAGPTAGLLALDTLGLVLTVLGTLAWLHTAWQHLANAALPWGGACAGALAVLAGGWALRVAHGLWSRVEVESVFTWLEFKGSYYRLPGLAAALPGDAPGWSRGEPAVGVEDLVLRSCVLRGRSVFYADGPQDIGSRVLRTLAADATGAAVWTGLARQFARQLEANPAAATPTAAAARAKAQARRLSDAAKNGAARRAARFCGRCGTPLLDGARACQQCGQTQAA